MRHFDQLADEVRLPRGVDAEPGTFDRSSERSVLAHALGATLYVPATRSDLARTVRRRADRGARSMVIDLEDAITDPSVDAAVAATGDVLAELAQDPPESLLFVRVRSAAHIRELALVLGHGQAIVSGFVLPKFSTKTGEEYLQAVAEVDARSAHPVYADANAGGAVQGRSWSASGSC